MTKFLQRVVHGTPKFKRRQEKFRQEEQARVSRELTEARQQERLSAQREEVRRLKSRTRGRTFLFRAGRSAGQFARGVSKATRPRVTRRRFRRARARRPTGTTIVIGGARPRARRRRRRVRRDMGGSFSARGFGI